MAIIWQADFQSLPLKDLAVQAKDASRVSLVDVERTGRKALQLTAQPGDNNVAGSGAMERCDVFQAVPGGSAPKLYGDGTEQWLAHSIMFPDAFQFPMGPAHVLFQFHNYPDFPGMPNLLVNFVNWNGDNKKLGQLQLQRWVGDPTKPTERSVALGLPQKNVWYDFVYHVLWTPSAAGYFTAWLNGRLVMEHVGPTLYENSRVYMKLSNYHAPPQAMMQPRACSVIHDRVILGTTAEDVR